MKHFLKIADGIDVLPVLLELRQADDLWNQYRERKDATGSPHLAMSDIWLRYRARDELTEPKAYAEPHFSVWYPSINRLPSIRPIVFWLMNRVQATTLGGVMITKIPTGGRIEPHHDRGPWHAEFYNTKIYVPLQTNPFCWNRCENETVCFVSGEAWVFNNLVEHEVKNEGDDDRMTLIVCTKTEAQT